MEDESGDIELGPLVAAGKEGSGLLRRVAGAEELLVELGGGFSIVGEGVDGKSTRDAEGKRGRARVRVAWDDW